MGSWQDLPTSLQARIIAGDRSALDELARWAHAHRPGDVSDDVLQRVLGTLLAIMLAEGGRSRLRSIRNVPRLLAAITRRREIDESRKARVKRARFDLSVPDPEGLRWNPEVLVANKELRREVWRRLMCLNPLEREALIRFTFSNESYRDIAQAVFGPQSGLLEEGRLAVIVARARRKLRRSLRGLIA